MRGAAPHLGDQWQAEGQRLTRAGWGTSQHVTAGESVGDGSDLDVKRGDDAGAFKHGGQVVGHAKRGTKERGYSLRGTFLLCPNPEMGTSEERPA